MAGFSNPQMKRPLNILEHNPEDMANYIIRDPPKMVSSGKHWQVDVGAVVNQAGRDVSDLRDYVLPVPRNRNQTQYGISSARHVVNKNFRPPIIDPDSMYGESRRPRRPTRVRVNPSATWYTPANSENALDITAFVMRDGLDKVMKSNPRPIYRRPIHQTPSQMYGEILDHIQLEHKLPRASFQTAIKPSVTVRQGHGGVDEKFVNGYRRTTTGGESRAWQPYREFTQQPDDGDILLDSKIVVKPNINPKGAYSHVAKANIDVAQHLEDKIAVSYQTPAYINLRSVDIRDGVSIRDVRGGREYIPVGTNTHYIPTMDRQFYRPSVHLRD